MEKVRGKNIEWVGGTFAAKLNLMLMDLVSQPSRLIKEQKQNSAKSSWVEIIFGVSGLLLFNTFQGV